MTNDEAVAVMSALAHPVRLKVFRTIVDAGESGVAAGKVATQLEIPANTASTYLSILSGAGLLRAKRDGRSIIYHAHYVRAGELVRFWMEECCRGHAGLKDGLKSLINPAK